MRAAEVTAQMVAYRQSLGLAKKTPGRVPRQAEPTLVAASYYSEVVEDIRILQRLYETEIIPALAAWVAESDRERIRPDSALRVVDEHIRRDSGLIEVRRVVLFDAVVPKIRARLEQVLKGFNDRTPAARVEAKARQTAAKVSEF